MSRVKWAWSSHKTHNKQVDAILGKCNCTWLNDAYNFNLQRNWPNILNMWPVWIIKHNIRSRFCLCFYKNWFGMDFFTLYFSHMWPCLFEPAVDIWCMIIKLATTNGGTEDTRMSLQCHLIYVLQINYFHPLFFFRFNSYVHDILWKRFCGIYLSNFAIFSLRHPPNATINTERCSTNIFSNNRAVGLTYIYKNKFEQQRNRISKLWITCQNKKLNCCLRVQPRKSLRACVISLLYSLSLSSDIVHSALTPNVSSQYI
jgi:hypothetical protein